MPTVDEHGRPEPDPASNEVDTLLGFLEFQRATLEWKTRGLDESELRTPLPSSSMTLAGLLNHMAWVEDHWFSYFLLAHDRHDDWVGLTATVDRDAEWNEALVLAADDVRQRWGRACDASRRNVAVVLGRGSIDQLAARAWPSGVAPSLRWILVHMIEEYARHNGHADLLRESIDGQTGE